MDSALHSALTRYSNGPISYNGIADFLTAKFNADDRYFAYRRGVRERARQEQQRQHSEYGKAPQWAHDKVSNMKAEERLEYIPAYMEYLIELKEGNRKAVESSIFSRYFDIREEFNFDHWLAVHLEFPHRLLPAPNWDKLYPDPEPTKVEVDPYSGSITIWSW
jgi:hypothetical protein